MERPPSELVAGGGFEPPIPLGGIMSSSTTKPFGIKSSLGKKSLAALLLLQLKLASSGGSVIRVLLPENDIPRTISLAPGLKDS